MLSSPEIPDKKIKKPRIVFKIILAIIVVYLGIALVLHFVRINRYDYSYRADRWLELTATILVQPVVDVTIDRKSTYFYDWRDYPKEQIDGSVLPLTLRSRDSQLADYKQTFSSQNLQRDLGYVTEAAIVKPRNYEGEWSLVFCSIQDEVCQQSSLLHSGSVKVLVDGHSEMWAMDSDNKFIQLELVDYLNRNEQKDILFI